VDDAPAGGVGVDGVEGGTDVDGSERVGDPGEVDPVWASAEPAVSVTKPRVSATVRATVMRQPPSAAAGRDR
jgi:hypothetical protein